MSNIALVMLMSMDKRIQTSGFSKNVLRVIASEQGEENLDLKDALTEHRVVPDAYLIDAEENTVYIFEIEDTNEIDIPKLRRLSWLWFCLDCEEWELRVFVLDRYLQNWRVVPLVDVYFAFFEFDLPLDKTGRPDAERMRLIDWSATFEHVAKTSLLRPIARKEESGPPET